jgi:hypothetical protein
MAEMNDLSIKRVGGALVVLGVVTYVACVVFHLFAPPAFDGALRSMLPGFDWTPLGFLIGLGLVIIYSVYAAVVFVSTYNFFGRLNTKGHAWGRQQRAH